MPARSPGRLRPGSAAEARRSSSTVRTSCPIPAGAPTARPSAGWSGTTRTCRGTAPVSWSRAPDGSAAVLVAGGPDESVVPAPLARRRLALVRLRPQRLVEPLPLDGGRRGRADGPDGGGDRSAPVGVRRVPLRLPLRRSGRVRVQPRRLRPPRGARGRRRRPRARHPVHVDRVGRGARLRGRPHRCVPDGRGRGRAVRVDDLDLAAFEVLRPPRELELPAGLVSVPEPIDFPTAGGAVAHGLFYPPTNPGFVGPPGQLPPLLVMIHGGPTAAAIPALRLSVQYWTSRGFAVVDVNYRGSTGFGRAYRNLLRDSWGVADVEDCEAAARWLAAQGRVDPDRLCIRGGSAGGFTTLAAMATGDTFSAGRQPLRRRRPRGARPGDAQVREPVPRPADRPVPRTAGPVRRALTDPSPRGLRPAADRAAGPGGRGRAAGAVGDDRGRAAGPARAGGLRRRSRASSTASARPPTSAARSTPSCRSTARSSASSCRPPRASSRSPSTGGRSPSRAVRGDRGRRPVGSSRLAGCRTDAGARCRWARRASRTRRDPLELASHRPRTGVLVPPTFADLGVPADLVAVLERARHHHPLPHPGRHAARRARRPRHLRPGPDRLRQDPGLRPAPRRSTSARPGPASPAGWSSCRPASWPSRSASELAPLAGRPVVA